MANLHSLALLGALILCIAGVAFFSSSETAFLSLTQAKVQSLKMSGRLFCTLLSKLHKNLERLLTLILIGTNFCANLASSLGTSFAVALLGDSGALLSTFLVAFLITTFGQIIPKSIALQESERTALKRTLPLSILLKLLFPLVAIFGFFARVIKSEKKSADPSREALDTLFEIALREEVIPKDSEVLLSKALDFAFLKASDIVTKDKALQSVSATATGAEVIQKFAKTKVKSLAVTDSFGAIIGVTSYKDALRFFQEPAHPTKNATSSNKAPAIPPSSPIFVDPAQKSESETKAPLEKTASRQNLPKNPSKDSFWYPRGALHYTSAIFVRADTPLLEVLKTLSAAQSRIAFVRKELPAKNSFEKAGEQSIEGVITIDNILKAACGALGEGDY